MKSIKIRYFKSSFLIWILVFQFAFSQPLVAVAGTDSPKGLQDTTTDASEPTLFSGGQNPLVEAALIAGNIVQAQSNGTQIVPPTPQDNFHLKDQFRQILEPCKNDPTQDCVKSEHPLDNPQLTLPKVYFQSIADEFRVVRHPDELWLEHVVFDSKLNRVRVTDRHVIRNLTLTNIEGRPVELDEIFGLFATRNGLHAFLIPRMLESFGIMPLELPVVASPPPVEGAHITRIDILDYEKEVREFLGSATPRLGDVGVRINFQDAQGGPHTENAVITQSEILIQMRNALVALLTELGIANSDPQTFLLIQQMLADDIKDEQTYEVLKQKLLADDGDDVIKRAAVLIAQRSDLPRLSQLIKKEGGDLAKLVAAPREKMTRKRWEKHNETIQIGRDTELGSTLPWREILKRAYKNPDGWVVDLIGEAEKLQDQAALTKLQKAKRALKKAATPRRMLTLAAILAGTVALDATHHTEWLISAFSYLFHWTTQTPLLRNLTEDIANSSDYFLQSWALTRVMIGMAMIGLILPASLVIAQGISTALGKKTQDAMSSFFLLSAKLYAHVINPVQRFVWEKLAGQKNLYPALANGLDPFSTPGAFNNSTNLQAAIASDATRKARSIVMAAALVSEQRKTIDPATLMAILNAGNSNRLEYLKQSIIDVKEQKNFLYYASVVYRALIKLGDDGGNDPLDEDTILIYYEVFKKFADEIEEAERGSQEGRQVIEAIRNRGEQLLTTLRRNILPAILFGTKTIEQADKWKTQKPRPEDIKTAGEQYGVDYLMSDLAYGLAAPQLFSAVATGDLKNGAAEVLGNQAGQPFLYGFSVVDIANSRAGRAMALRMPERYAPLSRTLFQGDLVREQTFIQGLVALSKRTFDPQAPSMFTSARSYWTSNMTGFQGRFAVGSLVRAIAFGLKGKPILSAFPAEAFMLGTKYAVVMRTDGIQVGYTLLAWPVVTAWGDAIGDAAAENAEKVQTAIDVLYTGLIESDIGEVENGAAFVQALYDEGRESLPSHLAIPSHQYTLELGQKLLSYITGSPSHVPLATTPNGVWIKWVLNVAVGTGITTVLFNQTSNVLYSDHFNALVELARAIPWNAVTVAALSVLPHITKAGLTVAQPIIKPVGAVLGVNLELLDRGIQGCKRALSRATH